MEHEQISTEFGHNSVQEFRDRISMILGSTTVPFLLLFLIEHLSHGRFTMAALDIFVMLLLMVNSIVIYRGLNKRIPFSFIHVLILSVLVAAVFLIGGEALFWSFPLVFILAFLEDRKSSRILTALSLFLLIPLAFYALSFEYASRFTITLCLICIIGDVLFGYIFKIQSALSGLVIRDPLTNALNRRELDRNLNDAIEETKRGFGPASLIILDIDNFKDVNDSHGHGVGDKALIDLVETLHQRQRRLDYVFRIGGEEFLILLRNTTLEQALITAESLRQHVENKDLLEGQPITLSLGVAEFNGDETSTQWLERADKNLYDAKKSGRNQVSPAST